MLLSATAKTFCETQSLASSSQHTSPSDQNLQVAYHLNARNMPRPRRRYGRATGGESGSPSIAPSILSDAGSDARTITSVGESEYTRHTLTSMGDEEEEGEEGLLEETRLVIAVDYGTTYTGMDASLQRGIQMTGDRSSICHPQRYQLYPQTYRSCNGLGRWYG